MMHTN